MPTRPYARTPPRPGLVDPDPQNRRGPVTVSPHRMRWLLIVIVAGLLLKLLVVLIEPRLVFFPSRGEERTPADLGIRHTAIRIGTTDGEQLAAWVLEPD